MDYASFRSVIAVLSVLGMFVAIITNYWRHGNIDLTGRHANMRALYKRSITVGVVMAALLRANIIDILQNPEGPASLFGWLSLPWAEYANSIEKALGLVEEVFGIIVTGVVLAFISKFWNDIFDIIYEFKRWLRGKANALKPEESSGRTPSTLIRRPSRSPRGRASGGDSRRSSSSDSRSSSSNDSRRSSSGDSRRSSGSDSRRSPGGSGGGGSGGDR